MSEAKLNALSGTLARVACDLYQRIAPAATVVILVQTNEGAVYTGVAIPEPTMLEGSTADAVRALRDLLARVEREGLGAAADVTTIPVEREAKH